MKKEFYQDNTSGTKWGICFLSVFSFFLFLYSLLKSIFQPLTESESLLLLYAWNLSIPVVLHTVRSIKEEGITSFIQVVNIISMGSVWLGGIGIYVYGWF